MSLDYINQKKIRKSFGKIPLVTSLPNLVEVQKRSFDNFLQLRISPEKKQDFGLHAIFKSVFPINDYTERATVDYVNFDIGIPSKRFFDNEVNKYCYMWREGGQFSTERYHSKKDIDSS